MRKNYFLLILMLIGIGFSASAYQATIKVDDASHISTVSISGTSFVADGDGNFIIEWTSSYAYLYVKPAEGCYVESFTNSAGTPVGSIYYGEVSYSLASSDDGATFNVKTYVLEDRRTASCTIKVDDPEKVTVKTSGTYQTLSLSEGDNTVKFIPDVENQLTIAPASFGGTIYHVDLNGAAIAANYDSYNVTVSNGDVVNIQANYPNVDYSVDINVNEDAAGVVTGVTVDGTEATDWDSDNFKAHAGSTVKISFNTTDYKIESVMMNGSSVSYYSSYSFVVKEAAQVDITAHKYGTIPVYITVDNPANVIVATDYSYSNLITLNDGRQEVQIPEGSYGQYIYVKAAPDGYLTSVTQNGTDMTSRTSIPVVKNDEIVIVTQSIVRDKEFVAYIDADPSSLGYFGLSRDINNTRTDITSKLVASDYAVIPFWDNDNPFGISYYNSGNSGYIYLNDEIQGKDQTSVQLSLADGDVLKMYFNGAPKSNTVTFTVESNDAGFAAPSVKYDKIKELSDLSATVTALDGTLFEIVPESDIKVKVNGEAIDATDGVYSFVVEDNTSVTITDAKMSGVDSIVADDDVTVKGVYNLQGIRLDASAENLPAGLYIIDGKKVVVRK